MNSQEGRGVVTPASMTTLMNSADVFQQAAIWTYYTEKSCSELAWSR